MTEVVRRGRAADATGTVLAAGMCLQLKWPWLLLPLLVLGFTVALLAGSLVAAMMAGSAAGRAPVWKTSPLPVVFYGGFVDGRPGGGGCGPATVEGAERVAGETKVVFETGPGRVGFARRE